MLLKVLLGDFESFAGRLLNLGFESSSKVSAQHNHRFLPRFGWHFTGSKDHIVLIEESSLVYYVPSLRLRNAVLQHQLVREKPKVEWVHVRQVESRAIHVLCRAFADVQVVQSFGVLNVLGVGQHSHIVDSVVGVLSGLLE